MPQYSRPTSSTPKKPDLGKKHFQSTVNKHYYSPSANPTIEHFLKRCHKPSMSHNGINIDKIFEILNPIKQRVAIEGLAARKFEDLKGTSALKVAIDANDWIRSLQNEKILKISYIRLVKLLSFGIRPLIIFERNSLSFTNSNSIIKNTQTAFHRLARFLGINIWYAVGEGPAECAKLQLLGIVDFVYSNDCECLLFGCTKLINSWGSKHAQGNKLTHFDMYDLNYPQNAESYNRINLILAELFLNELQSTSKLHEISPIKAFEIVLKFRANHIFNTNDCSGQIERIISNFGDELLLCPELATVPVIGDSWNEEFKRYYHPRAQCEISMIRSSRTINWNREIPLNLLKQFCREVFEWNDRTFLNTIHQAYLMNVITIPKEKIKDMSDEIKHVHQILLDQARFDCQRKSMDIDCIYKHTRTQICLNKVFNFEESSESQNGPDEEVIQICGSDLQDTKVNAVKYAWIAEPFLLNGSLKDFYAKWARNFKRKMINDGAIQQNNTLFDVGICRLVAKPSDEQHLTKRPRCSQSSVY